MAVRDAEVKIQKAVPVRLRHHLLTRFGSARECPLAPPNSQVRRNYAPGGKEPEGGHQEAALFSGRGAPFLAAVIGCTSMPALHPLTPCAHGILLQSISRCAWGPHHQLNGGSSACPPTRSCAWSLSRQLLGCGKSRSRSSQDVIPRFSNSTNKVAAHPCLPCGLRRHRHLDIYPCHISSSGGKQAIAG